MFGLCTVVPFWSRAVDGDGEGGDFGCVGGDRHEAGEDSWCGRAGRGLGDGSAALGEEALDDRVVLRRVRDVFSYWGGYLGVELELD